MARILRRSLLSRIRLPWINQTRLTMTMPFHVAFYFFLVAVLCLGLHSILQHRHDRKNPRPTLPPLPPLPKPKNAWDRVSQEAVRWAHDGFRWVKGMERVREAMDY